MKHFQFCRRCRVYVRAHLPVKSGRKLHLLHSTFQFNNSHLIQHTGHLKPQKLPNFPCIYLKTHFRSTRVIWRNYCMLIYVADLYKGRWEIPACMQHEKMKFQFKCIYSASQLFIVTVQLDTEWKQRKNGKIKKYESLEILKFFSFTVHWHDYCWSSLLCISSFSLAVTVTEVYMWLYRSIACYICSLVEAKSVTHN